nr:hypothetical protein [Tanacetum cinerariifolium]
KLSERVLALEESKTAQDLVITRLKLRVKKLENKKKKARTLQPLKMRLFKVRVESSVEENLDEEDPSKQERSFYKVQVTLTQNKKKARTPHPLKRRLFKVRVESFAKENLDEKDPSKQRRSMIEETDQDAGVNLVQIDAEDQGRFNDETDFDAGFYKVQVTPTQVSAQGKAHIQKDQPEDQLGVLSVAKVLADAARKNVQTYTRRRRAVSTGSGGISTASRLFSTAKESVSTVGASMPVSTTGIVQEVNISIPSPFAVKDKGKGKIKESEDERTNKTKLQQEQDRLGHEVAVRLQEELDEEERQRMVRVHERFIQILLNKKKRLLNPHNRKYIAPSLTPILFSNMKRGFSREHTPLFPSMLAIQAEEGEDEAVYEEWDDRVERATTTAASLDTEHASGAKKPWGDSIAQTRSERVPTPSYDSPLLRVHTLGSDEYRFEQHELMVNVQQQSNDPPLSRELAARSSQATITDSLEVGSSKRAAKVELDYKGSKRQKTNEASSEEARLEKLKYVAKRELKHTLTFGMPIPKAMMSREIKESQAYVNYLTKYTHVQSGSSTLRKGMGKGLMRRGDVPTPKKKKKVILRRQRTITFDDNVLPDLDEAREGSCVAPKSPYHSSSFNDSSASANDEKTKRESDSDHDESDNDSEDGDEHDKFDSDEESVESENDGLDKDSDDADDN